MPVLPAGPEGQGRQMGVRSLMAACSHPGKQLCRQNELGFRLSVFIWLLKEKRNVVCYVWVILQVIKSEFFKVKTGPVISL